MKKFALGLAVCASLFCALAPLSAQEQPVPPNPRVVGDVYFLERIALPPSALLHVSLVGSVEGAPYLPLATGIFPARNGATNFELRLPVGAVPPAPYRIQAWIVANGQLLMNGHAPQTVIWSLNDAPRIRVKPVGDSAIVNDQPVPLPRPIGEEGFVDVMPMLALVKGTVTKFDRRGLAPNAEIEVSIVDVSRADAPSQILASKRFKLEGKQLPFPFEIPVNVTPLRPNGRYQIRATIHEGERLSYTTDTPIPFSKQNANEPFELRVVPAQ